MSGTPQSPQPNLFEALRATVKDVASDASTAAALAAARERVHQVVHRAVDQVVDTALEVAATAASMAAEHITAEQDSSEPGTQSTSATLSDAEPTATRARPGQTAVSGGEPVDVRALAEGDEVLVRATVVRTQTGQALVALRSKTDDYQAWVSADLVTAVPYIDPDFIFGAQYAAQRPQDRDVSWLYLPRAAEDARPFVALAGQRVGRREPRQAMPSRLVQTAGPDRFHL